MSTQKPQGAEWPPRIKVKGWRVLWHDYFNAHYVEAFTTNPSCNTEDLTEYLTLQESQAQITSLEALIEELSADVVDCFECGAKKINNKFYHAEDCKNRDLWMRVSDALAQFQAARKGGA